ncbi:nitroreductase family protein [Proteinivorax hydrogeniformans]|uniref:Nitroreductase family protein n=1 Tax=Proteinivorax hydrogeniformans TaxID=1826727 RepID=A0AAU8HUQ4_9FIRM
MDPLFERRSIRKFKDKPVEKDLIKQVLKAGMCAPSACNCKPWHFIVIDDREVLDKIPKFHTYAQMVKESPVAILVCAEPSNERIAGFWPQDCAAATQNILLEATKKGLGTVWVGVHPNEQFEEDFRKLLGIPEDIVPFALIPMGYPDEDKGKNDRYLEDRVHQNKW